MRKHSSRPIEHSSSPIRIDRRSYTAWVMIGLARVTKTLESTADVNIAGICPQTSNPAVDSSPRADHSRCTKHRHNIVNRCGGACPE